MKLIVLMNPNIFDDAESICSGNSHVSSRPVSFLLHPILGEMRSRSIGMLSRREGAASIWDTWYIGMRFCKSGCVLFSTFFHRNWIRGALIYQNTHHLMWWVKVKHKINIRDASLDSQPKILSSSVEELLQKIMGQTNNNCRFRIFTLTNSLHQPRLLIGRWDSRLRCVFVSQFFTRQLSIGSKKWSWLIQWMIWYFRHQQEEFECQILKYSMQRLLEHWTKSSIILISKEESVWRNKKSQKQDRFFPSRQSITSGSQEPAVLSRIMPTLRKNRNLDILENMNTIWLYTVFVSFIDKSSPRSNRLADLSVNKVSELTIPPKKITVTNRK